MAGVDFYSSASFDASVALKYPKDMTAALAGVKAILKERGKLVVEVDNPNLSAVRTLAASATGDLTTFYQIRSDDAKVWDVLKEAINTDAIRVLALFHGRTPPNLPENMVVIDVGKSLHEKVSKAVVSSLSESLTSKSKFPTGDPTNLYYGVQSLCYEVLYSPEYKVYGTKVTNQVPKAHAFNFMYNPPQALTPTSMLSAVSRFVEDVHGWMG